MTEVTLNPCGSEAIQAKIDNIGNVPATYHFNAGHYDLVSQLKLFSNTKFECEEDTVFKLMKDLPESLFKSHNPIITQKVANISGLDISGFKFIGNGKNHKMYLLKMINLMDLSMVKDTTIYLDSPASANPNFII